MASTTGFEALTIGKLSKAVGMSKSGLFAHFNSKEQLQLDLLKAVVEKFSKIVIEPSLKVRRGEPRIRALAKNILTWDNSGFMPGGCMIHTATIEFEGRPGPVRNFLVSHQKYWINFIEKAAGIAVEERQFRKNLDINLFAFEFLAIFPSYHYSSHLLNDPQAENRAWIMFERLIKDAQI
jgi:AcrR family transcriptional regulator